MRDAVSNEPTSQAIQSFAVQLYFHSLTNSLPLAIPLPVSIASRHAVKRMHRIQGSG